MQLLNNLNDEQLTILANIVDKHYCANNLGTKESCADKDGTIHKENIPTKPKHVSKMPFLEKDNLQHPNSLMKRAK